MLFDLEWPEIKIFLLNDVKLSDKPSAIGAVKSRFKKLQSFFLGIEFDRENFNRFIAYLREKHYSTSYVNNFIKIGKHIDKFLGTNLIQDFTYFKENKSWSGDTLSPKQIRMIANIHINYRFNPEVLNKRNRVLYTLLGTTGCRIGEAINAKFEDVHASPPYIVFRDTKNNEDRAVPISNHLYEEIMEMPQKVGFIFTSRTNKLLSSQEINLDLKRRALACGIHTKVYNHLFRHSYITTMKESGVDNADIAVIVGHKDPKTTARYTHGSLQYYSDIIKNHPLLITERTWEQTVEKMKKETRRTIDTSRFNLSINESKRRLEIKIESRNY